LRPLSTPSTPTRPPPPPLRQASTLVPTLLLLAAALWGALRAVSRRRSPTRPPPSWTVAPVAGRPSPLPLAFGHPNQPCMLGHGAGKRLTQVQIFFSANPNQTDRARVRPPYTREGIPQAGQIPMKNLVKSQFYVSFPLAPPLSLIYLFIVCVKPKCFAFNLIFFKFDRGFDFPLF